MQKWEYLIFGLHLDVGNGCYSIDGKLCQDSQFTDRTQYSFLVFRTKRLNELGDKGWELVSEDAGTYIFKRPK